MSQSVQPTAKPTVSPNAAPRVDVVAARLRQHRAELGQAHGAQQRVEAADDPDRQDRPRGEGSWAATRPGVRRMPTPIVLPTMTARPKPTPRMRSEAARRAGGRDVSSRSRGLVIGCRPCYTSPAMEYRRLGTPGSRSRASGSGCGNFGGIGSAPAFYGRGESEAQAFALMDRACDGGINFFDTADAYGGGRSETFIGRWLKREGLARPGPAAAQLEGVQPGRPGPERPRPVAPAHPAAGRRQPGAAADRSAGHVPDPRARPGDAARGDAAARSTTRCARARCCTSARATSRPGGWRAPSASASGTGWAPLRMGAELLQPARPRTPEREMLPLCADQGLGFTAFSPLAGGWLTGKYRRGRAVPGRLAHDAAAGALRHLVSDRVVPRAGGARRRARGRAA